MRLHQILDLMSALEKRQFLNVLESLADKSGRRSEVEMLLDRSVSDALKSAEGVVITSVFELLKNEFLQYIIGEIENFNTHAVLYTDILSRDGNSIVPGRWFDTLYGQEIQKLKQRIQDLGETIDADANVGDRERLRDYKVFRRCVLAAFSNDLNNNLEAKITADESAILKALSNELGLSSQEVCEIIFLVVPLTKQDEADALEYLRKTGLVFIQRKTGTIYVPDEVVSLFRLAHGKELADKHFRTMLRLLKDPELNQICKMHGLPMRGVDTDSKIKSIIEAGVSFSNCFEKDIYKPEDSLAERKKRLTEICESGFPGIKLGGSTLKDKLSSIIHFFSELDQDDRVEIGKMGYEKLLQDLSHHVPEFPLKLRQAFQFQEHESLGGDFLLDRGIKPRDILDLLTEAERKLFCTAAGLSKRNTDVVGIINAYKNSDNILLENYGLLAARDLNGLKEVGVLLKEADLGVKFEEVTKQILLDLGLQVDEALRKEMSTAKDKMDILIRLEKDELILLECKSSKDVAYSKFSSLTRQMKSYKDVLQAKGERVVKSLLIAPDFSDEFIEAVESEYELNLTLVTAESLKAIHEAFQERKSSGNVVFPQKALAHARDVLLNADRIIKSISK
jgi:hypothetical protein